MNWSSVLLGDKVLKIAKHVMEIISKSGNEMKVVVTTYTTNGVVV